ncbi:MAG: T9SS type A sorting domain-containing protein, partial [Sphingobacteriales bacterium]
NKGSIRLLNVLGQTVVQQRNINGRRFVINTSALAAGTYIVEVTNGASISRIKIVKE